MRTGGNALEAGLHFIRDSYEAGCVLWHVESAFPEESRGRLREWKDLLGAQFRQSHVTPAIEAGRPKAVAVELPMTLRRYSYLVLMANKAALRPDIGVVWRPYRWKEGPVKVDDFEMVYPEPRGQARARWRLTVDRSAMVEQIIQSAVEAGDERQLRFAKSVVEALPRIDGIQRRFVQMLDDAAKEWAVRHAERCPLNSTVTTESSTAIRGSNQASGDQASVGVRCVDQARSDKDGAQSWTVGIKLPKNGMGVFEG